MGDSSRHPPRGSGYQPSQHGSSAQNLTFGAEPNPMAATNSVVHGNLDNTNPIRAQPAALHHQDQPATLQTPATQPSMGYSGRGAPIYTSGLNMGYMASALPSHQPQHPAYSPGQPVLQHMTPSTYGMPQHGHRYQAQHGQFNLPYPHGQYVNAYMPVSPQGYSQTYTPNMYNPYPVYAQQSGPMYPPAFVGNQTYPQRSNHDHSGRIAHPKNPALQDSLTPSGAPPGPAAERFIDTRAVFLEPGHVNSIASSGQNAVKGSWYDHMPRTSIPMGPPRKPRQSGHALWVGNLPPGATVTDLKDHFSKGATKDIESVKLISKSNCAFVNYRTQAACVAAMNRFMEAKFHGTRLVCRLRRTSVNNPSAAASSGDSAPREPSLEGHAERSGEEQLTSVVSSNETGKDRTLARFFVLKSLTLHDLEISTHTGIWATQPHNEERLNEAFDNTENVYLIFSANKSGEYFGYARMHSAITPSDKTDGIYEINMPSVPAAGPLTDANTPTLTTDITSTIDLGPKSIPTPQTEYAPKGRIIDDSARGTIFWEADMDDENAEDAPATPFSDTTINHTDAIPTSYAGQPAIAGSSIASSSRPSSSVGEHASTEENLGGSSGNSFKVEWLSTRRVPFFKSRGLRNPWNANREVKIARDGTELETVVGGRLLQLFGPPNVQYMLQN